MHSCLKHGLSEPQINASLPLLGQLINNLDLHVSSVGNVGAPSANGDHTFIHRPKGTALDRKARDLCHVKPFDSAWCRLGQLHSPA